MSEVENPPPESQAAEAPAAATPAPSGPVRWTSIGGTLASALLCAAWFLPWVNVEPTLARDFRATVTREIERRDTPSQAAGEYLQIAVTLEESGSLRGTDFIHWLRAGQAFGSELDAGVNPGVGADVHQRRLRLVMIMLYGIPIAAVLLALHFLTHRFRRARSPILILCILTGLAAVVVACALDYTHAFMRGAIEGGSASLGLGWQTLLVGGVGLALAGFFGVRGRNWFRVYVISAATASALGFLAVRYLEVGGLL